MILALFNGRNDNLGDRLIFSCLCEQLAVNDQLFLLGEGEFSWAEDNLRLRQALLKVLIMRIQGKRSKLFYPPGAQFMPRVPKRSTIKQKVRDRTILLLWSLLGCSIHILGISVSEEVSRTSKYYRRFRTIGVRDRKSAVRLSRHHTRVTLCPDLAFLQQPKHPTSNVDKVIVSFRFETPDNHYDYSYGDILRDCIMAVFDEFGEKFFAVDFFANVEEDKEFNRELARACQVKEKSASKFYEEAPLDLNYGSFFEGYGAVVSNRLHVLLPAMSEGLLPIALVSKNHSKIVDLFETYGLENFVIYLEQPKDDLNAQLRFLLNNAEILRAENFHKLVNLRDEVLTYIRFVLAE